MKLAQGGCLPGMKLVQGGGGGGGGGGLLTRHETSTGRVLTRYETKSRTSKLLEYYYSKANNFAVVYHSR